jgi:hypothetical protein
MNRPEKLIHAAEIDSSKVSAGLTARLRVQLKNFSKGSQ